MKTIKIGTRRSKLAIAQTMLVIDALKSVCPEIECEVVEITTMGDKILNKALPEFGGKGVFVEEFEQGILDGRFDIAVHSGKDLPTSLADGLKISAVLPRQDARDILITPKNKTLDLTKPFSVGTGSARRSLQLKKIYPLAKCTLLRGNVPTRLNKMLDGEYDAIILAAAGLNRLSITEKDGFCFNYLDIKSFVPAAAQGIIAIESAENSPVNELLEKINHSETFTCFMTERKVMELLEADCHQAVGAYSFITDDKITIYGFIGESSVKCVTENKENFSLAAEKLAGELK